MPTINQLPSASTLSSSDQLPVYSSSNGDARKASLSALLAWFRSTFASPDFEAVLEAPTGSGFNIQLAASTESLWLIANPTGAFAAGTITLPPVADCFDGQEIIVTCSQAVTALTVDGNVATVLGEPSGLGTGGFFALRFRESQSTWYTTSQSLGATSTFNTINVDTVNGPNDVVTIKGDSDPGAVAVFSAVGAGGVNYLSINNEVTGSSPFIQAAGSDADIGIQILAKGLGGIAIIGDTINLSGTLTTSALTAPSVETLSTTVADLGSAAVKGVRKFVTDSNAAMTAGIGAVVAGGGANNVPVYSDGTNWRIG